MANQQVVQPQKIDFGAHGHPKSARSRREAELFMRSQVNRHTTYWPDVEESIEVGAQCGGFSRFKDSVHKHKTAIKNNGIVYPADNILKHTFLNPKLSGDDCLRNSQIQRYTGERRNRLSFGAGIELNSNTLMQYNLARMLDYHEIPHNLQGHHTRYDTNLAQELQNIREFTTKTPTRQIDLASIQDRMGELFDGAGLSTAYIDEFFDHARSQVGDVCPVYDTLFGPDGELINAPISNGRKIYLFTHSFYYMKLDDLVGFQRGNKLFINVHKFEGEKGQFPVKGDAEFHWRTVAKETAPWDGARVIAMTPVEAGGSTYVNPDLTPFLSKGWFLVRGHSGEPLIAFGTEMRSDNDASIYTFVVEDLTEATMMFALEKELSSRLVQPQALPAEEGVDRSELVKTARVLAAKIDVTSDTAKQSKEVENMVAQIMARNKDKGMDVKDVTIAAVAAYKERVENAKIILDELADTQYKNRDTNAIARRVYSDSWIYARLRQIRQTYSRDLTSRNTFMSATMVNPVSTMARAMIAMMEFFSSGRPLGVK
jgi:hypothetical protein